MIYKILLFVLFYFLCVLGIHLIISSYIEAHYWECSFYFVSEYLLLNSLLDFKIFDNEKD